MTESEQFAAMLRRRASLVEPLEGSDGVADEIDYAIARTLRDLASDIEDLESKGGEE